PADRAIIAGIAGSLIYVLVGRSRFAIISPTSSAAAILAATLAAMPASLGDKAVLATAAVLLTGVMFAIAALLRLGGLTQLIARPVLRGFAFGIALTIILKQLPVMAGVAVAGTNPRIQFSALIGAHARWNLTGLAMGALALLAY
ncbi:SulP family inorganic anion transporter, partial [Thioclava sp. BHET1]